MRNNNNYFFLEMGTNFYARIIPSEQDIKSFICSDDIEDAIEAGDVKSMTEYVKKGNQIHLGKRSGGWKFVWNPNVFKINRRWRYTYPLTKQGITDFLNQEGMMITDEFGKTYEPDEFLEMAFNWCPNGLDAKKYYTDPIYAGSYYYLGVYVEPIFITNKWKRLGYDAKYGCFYSDGLVFSDNVAFS